jgi:hypothetical protein
LEAAQNFTTGPHSFSISPSSGFGDGDDGQPIFFKKKDRYLDVLKLIIQLTQVPALYHYMSDIAASA